jgi:hypothetical protein
MIRRIERDGCTKDWYQNLVWKHYLEFKEEQIENIDLILNGKDDIEKNIELIKKKLI